MGQKQATKQSEKITSKIEVNKFSIGYLVLIIKKLFSGK
jgi:hypothetical protein